MREPTRLLRRTPTRERATSFGRDTVSYNVGRPGYPIEAVDWLVSRRACVVADVGAGTGKLTGILTMLGHEVIAIDPDPRVLGSLTQQHPNARVIVGSGEKIPLSDGSVDAVTFGQAWHWVNPRDACREVARVLAPGGSLGLIWNIRDKSVPWVRELNRIMGASRPEQMLDDGTPLLTSPFSELECHRFRWEHTMSRRDIVALARSRSHLITAPRAERSRIIADISHLLIHHPDLAGKNTLRMPYVTHAFRSKLG